MHLTGKCVKWFSLWRNKAGRMQPLAGRGNKRLNKLKYSRIPRLFQKVRIPSPPPLYLQCTLHYFQNIIVYMTLGFHSHCRYIILEHLFNPPSLSVSFSLSFSVSLLLSPTNSPIYLSLSYPPHLSLSFFPPFSYCQFNTIPPMRRVWEREIETPKC